MSEGELRSGFGSFSGGKPRKKDLGLLVWVYSGVLIFCPLVFYPKLRNLGAELSEEAQAH